MKVIELTCPNHGKEDVGVLLTQKERILVQDAVKEYSQKYPRRTTAKTLLAYMRKHMPY